jgi:hypothetical protein
MKRRHQRAHVVIWILLVPILVALVYFADRGRLSPALQEDNLTQPSTTGVLP